MPRFLSRVMTEMRSSTERRFGSFVLPPETCFIASLSCSLIETFADELMLPLLFCGVKKSSVGTYPSVATSDWNTDVLFAGVVFLSDAASASSWTFLLMLHRPIGRPASSFMSIEEQIQWLPFGA